MNRGDIDQSQIILEEHFMPPNAERHSRLLNPPDSAIRSVK